MSNTTNMTGHDMPKGNMSSHDMGSKGGIPWLDQPVTLHSSRADTCKLSQVDCEYRSGYWRYWYTADYVYARGTVYFCCALIILFFLIHMFSKWSSPRKRSSTAVRKLFAILRFIEYKSYYIKSLRFYSPTLGIMFVLVTGALFFSFMTFGPQPYYWPNTKTKSFGNSPPLATRTGWMALGLLPFILALGSKQNLITLFTGVPHEKLQVYHQWASYAMFALALIHTFPFIIFHIWKGDMVKMWKTMVVYWTGVVALVAQAWLTFASLGPLRRKYYEFFKISHFIAAMLFFVFFFLHCDFRLTSWDYFIAAAAVYLSTLAYSQLRSYLFYGCSHKAVVTPLPCGILQVTILVHPGSVTHSKTPMNISWHPGQHVFIRFLTLGLHAFSAHPFTICSLPPSKDKHDPSNLILYIQPEGGFTKRLELLAKKTSNFTVPILLDGPYGGLSIKSLAAFDRAVIIVGGSGAGFSLPIVEDILFSKDFRQRGPGRVTRIQVVLATRSHEVRAWYATEIQRMLLQYLSAEFLQVEIYITDKNAPPAASDEKYSIIRDARNSIIRDRPGSPSSSYGDAGKAGMEGLRTQRSITSALNVFKGRPDVSRIVEEATSTPYETVGIAVCGPSGLVYNVHQAAALAQSRVMIGKGANEVYLHSESFSW